MSDRDLFIAMLLASISSGSSDPLGDTLRVFGSFMKMDAHGSIPK